MSVGPWGHIGSISSPLRAGIGPSELRLEVLDLGSPEAELLLQLRDATLLRNGGLLAGKKIFLRI